MAQDNVVRAITAFYREGLNLVVHINQTPPNVTSNYGIIDNVGDLNRCANVHRNLFDKGTENIMTV